MKKEIEERIYIFDYPGLVALIVFDIFCFVLSIISCEDWIERISIAIVLGIPLSGILVCFWLSLTKKAEREPDASKKKRKGWW